MNLKRVLPRVLSVLWMIFAFFLSLQNGDGTDELSGGLTRWLIDLLGAVDIHLDYAGFHMFLRTAAHFVVFFVLEILFCWSAVSGRDPVRRWHLQAALGAGIMIAVLAEVGKQWIPGRHLQWDEVLLNVSGVGCGYGVWKSGTVLANARKNSRRR